MKYIKTYEEKEHLKVGDLVKYLRDINGVYKITHICDWINSRGKHFYNIEAVDPDCSEKEHRIVSSVRHLTNEEREEWQLKKAARKYNL